MMGNCHPCFALPESSVEPDSPKAPHNKINKSSSSTSAIIITTTTTIQPEATLTSQSPRYQVIPTVITTKYSVESLQSEFEQMVSRDEQSDVNTGSLSASVDDLESSSADQLDLREREEVVTREDRAVSLLTAQAQLEEDGMLAGYSISAPDLLLLTDNDDDDEDDEEGEGHGHDTIDIKELATVSVEESIAEHRSLLQRGGYSSVSDTGTDHTNTSVDSDFVVVLSPNQQAPPPPPPPPQQEAEVDTRKELEFDTFLQQSVEVTKRPAKSATRKTKSHRRSLSTSDVENMRKSADVEAEVEDEAKEREGGRKRPSTTNCIAVLTPISNADEGGAFGSGCASPRKQDDEYSQTGSVQTLDTSSHHGSDDSSEDGDVLSALDSQASLEPVRFNLAHNGVSNLSPVVFRVGRRKPVNPLDRYSAEYLITNIDDGFGEGSDGETTPTLLFSQRRINSTSVPMSSVGRSDATPVAELEDDDDIDGPLNQSSSSLRVNKKKISMCSNDSVFMNNSEDVLTLSDVDVKVNDDVPSLDGSYEVNLDLSVSVERDSRYYSQSGLPKTIRKKIRKSKKNSSSPKADKKGPLNKSEVSPTIRTLRKLINLEELDDSCSDDSDTPSGSVRASSALERSTVSSIQRSKSSVSDSVAMHQHHKTAVTFATVPGHRSESPISTGARSPLQPAQHVEQEEITSLDFVPGSPLATRKQQQLFNQPPASPLSYSRTTPTSQNLSTDSNRPSGAFSPAFGTPTHTPTHDSIAEDEIHTAENHTAKLPWRKSGKLEKSRSVYESSTESVSSIFVNPKEPIRELDVCREPESSVMKKFIRASFFRGSKQNSKKASKTTSLSRSESEQDSPQPTSYHSRVKSAKMRSKNSDTSLDIVAGSPTTNSLTHSASMHVGLKEASGGEVESKRRPVSQMTRYSSADVLSSPTKISTDKSLTTLEETPPVWAPTFSFPPPPPHASGGESDNEEVSIVDQVAISTNHPELELKEDLAWSRTVDRKLYKSINKGERERQAILHEVLHTEKQHFRALHVLKLIFRQGTSKQVSEEVLYSLFPKLDELIEISDNFIKQMEKMKSGNMIVDLSQVLQEQFSGDSYDKMLSAFSGFCSGHLNAMAINRELLKKKNYVRLMNEMHSLKECQRLTLPDYYTKVTQRLSQLITLMNRLVKKTESLKLDHFPVLQQGMHGLQRLVAAVDQAVADWKNLMEAMDIQSRLEITFPKSSKIPNKKDLKNLSLTTPVRKMKRRGDATWMGHGRQLGKWQ